MNFFKTKYVLFVSAILFSAFAAQAGQHKLKGVKKMKEQERHTNFSCTIYYCPQESGFDNAHGFNPTTTSTITVGGTDYTVQADFKSQATTEGSGMMKNNICLNYDDSGWRIVSSPQGNRANNALNPKHSCAANSTQWKSGWCANTVNLSISSAFGNSKFSCDDCGPFVNKDHLDLYWGIANPRSKSGHDYPEGTTFTTKNSVVVFRTAN